MNKTTLLLALCLPTAACTHPDPGRDHARDATEARHSRHAESPPPLLRTYEVPEGTAVALRDTLSRVFAGSKNEGATARVAVAPDGRLVVAGPDRIHEGVAEMLQQMKAVTRGRPSVAVTYWIVRATPTAASRFDPSLDEIRAPLMAATRGQTVEVTSVERVTLRSAQDVRASHEGRSAEVRQTLRREDDRLLGDLEVEHHGPRGAELRTQVELPPGAPVVIGEMDLDADESGARPRLLLVVRAEAS